MDRVGGGKKVRGCILGAARPRMHYHSAQHGESRPHRAARFQHGETQLPSSTSLPEPPAPPPSAPAPAASISHLERMQAELKAVQQQALATQQSLQQLQSRKPQDPFSAIVSELGTVPAAEGTLAGAVAVLALAGAAAWWFVWQRPRKRWTDAGDTRLQTAAPMPAPASLVPDTTPKNPSTGWASSTAAGELSTAGFESSSAHARLDRDIAFDSEAAATEVIRVRKSLAEKRVARASYLDREEAPEPKPHADLDLELDLDAVEPPAAPTRLDNRMPPTVVPDATPEPQPEPEPVLDVDSALALDLDLGLDPWHQPGESLPGATDDPAGDAIHFSLALEDYGMKPEAPSAPDVPTHYELAMDPIPEVNADAANAEAPGLAHAPEPGAAGYDFTITLALAQESAALELWTEARDLATEVLASDNAALVDQATALLERLQQMEHDAPPDTNWSTVR